MSSIQAYTPRFQYNQPATTQSPLDQGNRTKSPIVADRENAGKSGTTRSTSLTTEYYSSDTTSLTFTNKDGDSVQLSMQHVEYQKAQVDIQMTNSTGDTSATSNDQWDAIVKKIMDEFSSVKDQIIKQFFANINGDSTDSNTTDPATPVVTDGKEVAAAPVPEYWNAENTSKRIVAFATSFLDSFAGAGDDFLKQIKDAIDNGFKQAKDFFGNTMPDSVTKLVDDTYKLTMQKLDEWARSRGIGTGTDSEKTDVAPTQDVVAAKVDA